jgi:subtilisin family serine protease
MVKSIRITALASVIGVVLAGGVVSSPVATAQSSATTAAAIESYIVTFNEPGLLYYTGGANSLEATAPSVKGQRKLDTKSPAAIAYSSHLADVRAQRVKSISSVIGREVSATHHYAITENGIAALLSASEADAVRNLPGVKSIRAAGFETLDTFRGPSFIGADAVWSGTGVPGGTGTRGFGVTVGVIDGGTNSDHPSFANDASCGFSGATPKLRSFVDCATTDAGTGACNGPNPEANGDDDGHGVHTSSTAAGNTLTASSVPAPVIPAPFTSMSGVAPCASIRQYKACPGLTCPGADIAAAMQNAIADGVDVVNYSISGGRNPWTIGDGDRTFLDMINADIVVSASAGNTSPTITNPVGQVNHLGPWVMTVAASTHDENVLALVSIAGPGTPPPSTVGVAAKQGSTTPVGTGFTAQPIKSFPANLEGCTAGTAIPAGYFTGSVAYVRRGTCSFTEKITNAVNAGAIFVLVGNNQAGPLSMDTTAAPTTVPAYSVKQAPGDAIRDFIAANPTTATFSFDPSQKKGDVLADFSLRGPVPAAFPSVTKPDITGPGVQIYAAVADPEQYGYISGTSMSSPHLAGSAALVRAAKPAWAPMEVKSALQLTAKIAGNDDDGSSAWDPDDVGNGRVDLTKAIKAALVMNETGANFLAANPTGGSISAKTLNLPSMRDTACNVTCSFTRTMTSKVAGGTTWTATYVPMVSSGAPVVTITPANFTVVGGGTQALNIAVNMGYGSGAAPLAFGHVVLTPSDNTLPTERLTLSVSGTRDGIFKDNFGTLPPSVTYNEDFADITTLPGLGWSTHQNSVPVGQTGWSQGTWDGKDVFPAQAGADTSYISANFNNTTGTGTIDNWLVTPVITWNSASTLSFWTRAPDGTQWADRLEVRLCPSVPCTALSPSATATATFPTVVATVNQTLAATGYPQVWTQISIPSATLPSSGQGRIAFRYWVTNGGPTGANSNYIGIDTVSITAGAVNNAPVPNGGAGMTPDSVPQQVRRDK